VIGSRIKAMRLARRLSLTELARRAGVSKSFVSQVERGQANPSVETIRDIALALEVPLFSLFLEEHDPKGALVRKDERVTISLPGSDAMRQLLTTDINRDMVLVYSRLLPLGKSSPSPVTHKGEECIYVLAGSIIHIVGEQEYTLHEGDCLYFDARIPHLICNPSETEDSEFIAVMSPGILPPG
jgi:transcriptional regulator with XRE-family HTH domain